ncbi:MAG: virginiamycin B lyase family protein [Nitrososphaeraceae archaeon]
MMSIPLLIFKDVNAQVLGPEDLVTYTTQSNFIKEFKVPLEELGLKGIATDADENVWFYHSTNQSSTILVLNITTQQFKQYAIEAKTLVDTALVNLAGGQIVYDNTRNAIWFTDARTNSIGNLDIKSGIIKLYDIPTPNSGPMGIVLSPNGNEVWFTEITGNKLGKIDIESSSKSGNITSNAIKEYPVFEQPRGQSSGPTLLTFDNKGILWVTMSYSHDILRVEPWALTSTSKYLGMSNFSLPKPDSFSPFGIATVGDNVNTNDIKNTSKTERIFLSDHGSSRLVLATGNSALNPFQGYLSYWTSPSKVYPVTLPSQIVSDKSTDNIYFVQHGGNRISKIDIESGIMTEYDIPTGPLSTAVFLTVSDNGERVWFTEYAANKIAYLDPTTPVPFEMKINLNQNQSTDDNQSIYSINNESVITPLVLKPSEGRILDVTLKTEKINRDSNSNNTLNNTFAFLASDPSSLLSLNEVELSVIGMTETGLVPGLTYSANPQRINMSNVGGNTTLIQTNETYNSKIKLVLEKDRVEKTQHNEYSTMIKSSASEGIEQNQEQQQGVQHPLFVSLLFPIPVILDLPLSAIPGQQQVSDKNLIPNNDDEDNQSSRESFFGIRDISLLSLIRIISLSGAIALVGYLIYTRVKRSRKSNKER